MNKALKVSKYKKACANWKCCISKNLIRHHQDHIQKLKDTNAPDNDTPCPSGGFADTLDLDISDTPNGGLSAAELDPPRRNPPRRNPPRDCHPPHRYCPDDYRS